MSRIGGYLIGDTSSAGNLKALEMLVHAGADVKAKGQGQASPLPRPEFQDKTPPQLYDPYNDWYPSLWSKNTSRCRPRTSRLPVETRMD